MTSRFALECMHVYHLKKATSRYARESADPGASLPQRLLCADPLARPACNQKSPLFQLQVLFAFLQKSHQTVYDPEPLVSSLKLDTSEQQDATEFSKLFMTMLDDQFKKQGRKSANEGGNPAVARLVQDQVRRAAARSHG